MDSVSWLYPSKRRAVVVDTRCDAKALLESQSRKMKDHRGNERPSRQGSTNFFLAIPLRTLEARRRVPRTLRMPFGVCGTGFLAFLSLADTRIQTWEQHGRNYFSILQHVDGAALEVFTVVGLQVAAETDGKGTGQRNKRRENQISQLV